MRKYSIIIPKSSTTSSALSPFILIFFKSAQESLCLCYLLFIGFVGGGLVTYAPESLTAIST